MVYSTSRCPSCGKVIRRQTNPVKEIGMPFERCCHCGTIYRNSYKEEWITKSPIKRFFFFLQEGVWARAFLLPLVLFGVLMSVFDFEFERDVILVLWPICSAMWLVWGYFLHRKWEQEDIAASLERTRDPKYLNILKQAGYEIYPIEEKSIVDDIPEMMPNLQELNNEKIEIRFCRKCGQELIAGALYCNKCGEKIIFDSKK